MASTSRLAAADHIPVRKIGWSDVKYALASGLDDFLSLPSHALFLAIVYPMVGILLIRLTFGLDLVHYVLPLASGFALLGPLAALPLYELSRRREQGLPATASDAVHVLQARSLPAILTLGGMLVLLFITWLVTAEAIYGSTFGARAPSSLGAFLHEAFTTPHGWALLTIGTAVGFVFAVTVFAISVVSFPLMLDRHTSAAEAAATSLRAALHNPVAMMIWAMIIAAGLLLGSLPLFMGLIVVMPVLGHASWHLYRRVVPH